MEKLTTKIQKIVNQVQFDERHHTYLVDGEKLPSVTTIMKPVSMATYKGVPENVLSAAASKGTAVHEAIENHVKYGVVDIEPEYKGYFDAYCAWLRSNTPDGEMFSEVRVYHKTMRYAGTIDLLCMIDGKLVLIDFKTTQKIENLNCALQLEAYDRALASHKIKVDEKRIVQIRKDGKWAQEFFPAEDLGKWKVFSALKSVYDYIMLGK